jgi:hypothetical protein
VDEPRRDDVIDRELRRVFAAGGGAPAGAHLDAEIAAAWMERRLEMSELQAVETHLAGCVDCQAMVATLARLSDDVVAPGAPSWWQRLRGGWLLPATVAAAAGLVIWIAVPQQRGTPPAATSSSAPESSIAKSEVPADAKTSAVVAPGGPPTASASPAEQDSLRQFAQERSEPLRKAESRSQPTPAPAPPSSLADKSAIAAPPLTEEPRRDAAPKLEAERLSVDEQRRQRDTRETVTVTGQTPAPTAPAAGASAAARENSDTTASARSLGTLAAVRERRLGIATLMVVAPGDAARWRRAGDTFEFAPRADAPFTAAALPVDAAAIAAGASPGGTVCWLVGRGGTVLVSTDGVRFVRVAAPAETNLVGVAAADARSATVTAADGRRFRTADAGQTWSTVP